MADYNKSLVAAFSKVDVNHAEWEQLHASIPKSHRDDPGMRAFIDARRRDADAEIGRAIAELAVQLIPTWSEETDWPRLNAMICRFFDWSIERIGELTPQQLCGCLREMIDKQPHSQMKGEWRENPFGRPGTQNQSVSRCDFDGLVKAVRTVLADWDGENWSTILESLRVFRTDDQIRAMSLGDIQQYFAVNQVRLRSALQGTVHTVTNTIDSAESDGTGEVAISSDGTVSPVAPHVLRWRKVMKPLLNMVLFQPAETLESDTSMARWRLSAAPHSDAARVMLKEFAQEAVNRGHDEWANIFLSVSGKLPFLGTPHAPSDDDWELCRITMWKLAMLWQDQRSEGTESAITATRHPSTVADSNETDAPPIAERQSEIDELPPAFNKSKRVVLRALGEFDASHLATVNEIVSNMPLESRVADRTIRPIIKRLIALGFAERPDGPRRGVRLTIKGRKLLSKIAD